MKKTWIAAALAGLCNSPAWADPPPAAAPPYRAGVSLQPVALYDKDGNVIGVLTGSVTPAGTSGSQAQAVQGITGGVPVAIQGGNATAVKVDGSAVTQPVSAAALPLPAGAATAGNQATEIAALAAIGQRAATFTDATGAAVAANATFTGAVRDLGAAPAYARMNVAIYSAQNGTVTIQACQDAGCTIALVVASQPVNISTSVWATVSAPVHARYMRLVFQNGSTAGNVSISSSLTAN